MEEIFDFIQFIILFCIGYFVGTRVEKSHYKSIERREQRFLRMPAVTIKNVVNSDTEIVRAQLVTGSVVISIDYFKRVLAYLRNIFGGEIRSYETLIDRARREAILRMKESASGADTIVNLRIETSSVGKNAEQQKMVGSVEAIAYGTAIKFKR